MIVCYLQGCQVWAWPERQYCETRYPDASVVQAAPEDNDAYRAITQQCGYGADTWRQCLEHELSHSLLAEAQGLPYSPGLWRVAHGAEGYLPDEEGAVLAFQTFSMALRDLEQRGWTAATLLAVHAQLQEAS